MDHLVRFETFVREGFLKGDKPCGESAGSYIALRENIYINYWMENIIITDSSVAGQP